jgi:hypothetical protein
MDYASDNYCPRDFHFWTGISIIAAALERKIALKQANIIHYPNLYILLVSYPAVGKSTAMDRGVDILEDVKKLYDPGFRIIPNQVTEASFIDLMKHPEVKMIANRAEIVHTSGFFYASEASSSALQNTHGDFNASLTAMYDCPKFFRKKIKGEKFEVEIVNACMNLLAGTTFDFLKNVVDEKSVMGGFASRLLYVVSKDRVIRETQYDYIRPENDNLRQKLLEDIAQIHDLGGFIKPTDSFKKAVERAQPEFDRYLRDLGSPRMESLMARKLTNTIKLSMILSVAESNSLVVDERHFLAAAKLIDDVSKDNALVVSSALMSNKASQDAFTTFVLQSMGYAGAVRNMADFRIAFLKFGGDVSRFTATMDMLVAARAIDIFVDGSETYVKLLTDPNINL